MKHLLLAAAIGCLLSSPAFAQSGPDWCKQSQRNADLCALGAGAAVGLILSLAIGATMGSGDRDAPRSAAADDDRRTDDFNPNTAPPAFTYERDPLPGPDTSIGCLLGDRAFGTCH